MKKLLQGRQGLFLVLTFVVMVAVIILAKDIAKALLLISLLTNFLIISSNLIMISERHHYEIDDWAQAASGISSGYPLLAASSGFTQGPSDMRSVQGTSGTYKEEFASTPHHNPAAYPGGLEPEDIASMRLDVGAVPSLPPGAGPAYTPTSESPYPAPGNPYHLNRLESRPTAYPCHTGPAAELRDTHDADRKTVDHARWRHDPYRVAAGVMRRRELMDKYVREELDEEENRPWWGRWDF